MEQKLTIHDVLALQETVKIGTDLLLLPEQSPLLIEEAHALLNAKVIAPSASIINTATWKIMELEDRYRHERRGDVEPAWVKDMPITVRARLRFTYAITEEDAFTIVPSFMPTQRPSGQGEFNLQPTFNAGLSYMILQDGLCHDVYKVFGLWRLEHIKQLGFLQAPVPNGDLLMRQSLSESSRFLHSLDVYVIALVIGRNVGLSEPHMNTLGTLALSHDVGTPAGGDSVKLVDLNALDEDKNYPMILERVDLALLEKKYGVDKALLIEGIRNDGLLGEILDIADKLAYIARDISKTLHHIEAASRSPSDEILEKYGDILEQPGLKSLLHILSKFPYVCGIWDTVEVQDGHAVFTDTRRLIAFLKVRVLMFRELYYHPTARFGEYLMSRIFVKILYERGDLTRDMLLEMSDGELLHFIDKKFGSGLALDTCSSDLSRVRAFTTPEEAQAFMQELKQDGKIFALLDDNRRLIKTGADFLVKTPRGPRPLSEVDPGSVQELEEMATMLPLVHVYYLDGMPRLHPKKLAELVKYAQKTAARGT